MSKIEKTLDHELAAMEDKKDWETRVVVAGALIGALVGMITSLLLVRTSREAHGGPPAITTGDAMKVGITTIGLVRSIAALGDRK